VLVSALALLVIACEGGGESRPPTTTVQGELVGTSEEQPVQLDEAGGDGEQDEGAGDETKGKGKEKDKGKARDQADSD
jgi:hypothetical protein